MLTEVKKEKKEFVIPVYPVPKLPGFEVLKKRYLKTRDFYDLPEEVETDAYLYRDSFELERKVCFSRNMRLIIYPKDIMKIYGHSYSTARRMLESVRDARGLPPKAAVTIRDFCKETFLDYETIHAFIMES